jgi:uncharacterized damage-inducible protein DinB
VDQACDDPLDCPLSDGTYLNGNMIVCNHSEHCLRTKSVSSFVQGSGKHALAGLQEDIMITPAYVQMMARYNGWQNRSLCAAANGLSSAEREQERGAFFGSIHGTLSHILWGDQAWMHRFAGMPKPTGSISNSRYSMPDWQALVEARHAFDALISTWAQTVRPDWLAGELTWFSASLGQDVTKPVGLLVTHMFNHQTHHRGQIHAMLTAAGAKPEATDIPFMPDGF